MDPKAHCAHRGHGDDLSRPLARAIIEAGFATTSWARRTTSLEPYADTPATVAGALLQKDVRLAVEIARSSAAPRGAVFAAADAPLDAMAHPP